MPINDPEAIDDVDRAAGHRAGRRADSGGSKAAGGETTRATSCPPTADRCPRDRCSSTIPFNETLKLIYASPTANDLDNPDNITVTPRGGLLLCEDAAGGANVVGERLVGLTLDGNTFTFAQNNIVLTAQQIALAGKTVAPNDYRTQEFAGACYSPDGEWLFVEHPDAGNHVRDHRSVGRRTSLSAPDVQQRTARAAQSTGAPSAPF